jgi:small subunit ribosomal protein S24e
MEVEILSDKKNQMLRRKEVTFRIEHAETGSTPSRIDVRKAVANALKSENSLVFLKRFETKTGTRVAFGEANVYETLEQAKLVEPDYIVKRSMPPEKKEEEKKETPS